MEGAWLLLDSIYSDWQQQLYLVSQRRGHKIIAQFQGTFPFGFKTTSYMRLCFVKTKWKLSTVPIFVSHCFFSPILCLVKTKWKSSMVPIFESYYILMFLPNKYRSGISRTVYNLCFVNKNNLYSLVRHDTYGETSL